MKLREENPWKTANFATTRTAFDYYQTNDKGDLLVIKAPPLIQYTETVEEAQLLEEQLKAKGVASAKLVDVIPALCDSIAANHRPFEDGTVPMLDQLKSDPASVMQIFGVRPYGVMAEFSELKAAKEVHGKLLQFFSEMKDYGIHVIDRTPETLGVRKPGAAHAEQAAISDVHIAAR